MTSSRALADIADVPLGLVNGDYQTANEDALKVSHPDVMITYIDRSGHFPMLEKPEAFNTALREMIDALSR